MAHKTNGKPNISLGRQYIFTISIFSAILNLALRARSKLLENTSVVKMYLHRPYEVFDKI